MPRSSPEDRQREADALRPQVEAFLEFMTRHFDPSTLEDFRAIAEQAYASGSPTRLREVRDGLLEPVEAGAVGAVGAEEERRLDALLRERAGVSLDSLLARRLARIAKARAKGRITTRAQYDLVKERVETIWSDPARAEEFRALQALCTDYEERELRRARRGSRDPDAAA